MIAVRRVHYNFGLQHAVHWARELRKPLVVLEALRSGYRWASDRLHAFVLDGMAAQARALARGPALYLPYVEPRPDAGKGLLAALASRACVVVTDDFPGFFLPRMVAAAGRKLPVRLEQVDSNGLYPIAATERVFTTAASFRRHLQAELPRHLALLPRKNPLQGVRLPRLSALPARISRRWPAADPALLARDHRGLDALPIDHTVPVATTRGGAGAARAALRRFLTQGLDRYEERNQPDSDAASGLSPYLHFGHIAAHEVFVAVVQREDWTPANLAHRPTGRRAGWWGARAPVESFLDELITWRELGYNMSAKVAAYDRYESLPAWARSTLEDHLDDPREHIYTLRELAEARTGDPVWNAAQTQLLREGRIHNYLRMLWGKKVLEWTPDPRAAIRVLVELNNRYALDGRDPNSYSGIFWCLGRYDRAWGPERPIFGKVRYMSSASTTRKLRLAGYLETYAPDTHPSSAPGSGGAARVP